MKNPILFLTLATLPWFASASDITGTWKSEFDSQIGVQKYLKEKNVPHIWHVDSGVHNFAVWKNDLYLFVQRIFQ